MQRGVLTGIFPLLLVGLFVYNVHQGKGKGFARARTPMAAEMSAIFAGSMQRGKRRVKQVNNALKLDYNALYALPGNDDFLVQAYTQVFQRPPTPSEYSFQNSRLYQGIPREIILMDIIGTAGLMRSVPEAELTRMEGVQVRHQRREERKRMPVIGRFLRRRDSKAAARGLQPYLYGAVASLQRQMAQQAELAQEERQDTRAQLSTVMEARTNQLEAQGVAASAQMEARMATLANSAQVSAFESAVARNHQAMTETLARDLSAFSGRMDELGLQTESVAAAIMRGMDTSVQGLHAGVQALDAAVRADRAEAEALSAAQRRLQAIESAWKAGQGMDPAHAEGLLLDDISADRLAAVMQGNVLLVGQYAGSIRQASEGASGTGMVETASLDAWLAGHDVYDTVIVSGPMTAGRLLSSPERLQEAALRVRGRLHLATWATDQPAALCYDGFWPKDDADGVPFRWAKEGEAQVIALRNLEEQPVEAVAQWKTYAPNGGGTLSVLYGSHVATYPLRPGLNECSLPLSIARGNSQIILAYESTLPLVHDTSFNRLLTFTVHGLQIQPVLREEFLPEISRAAFGRPGVLLASARGALHEAGFYEVDATAYRNWGLLHRALGASRYRFAEDFVQETQGEALGEGAVVINAYRCVSAKQEG